MEAAIRRCDPALILFSGHAFAGSLAFELPNGRIELPPPALLIKKLEEAAQPSRRLRCCFLNGCNTGELGYHVAEELETLKVICWSTPLEDAAARSFALGFYDAIGAFLSSGDDLSGELALPEYVELAFWAGVEHFYKDGFRMGDPTKHLHPPGHPHISRPQFSPPCFGCTPPVHGQVLLLRHGAGGAVERLVTETGGVGGEISWRPCKPSGEFVPRTLAGEAPALSRNSAEGSSPWRTSAIATTSATCQPCQQPQQQQQVCAATQATGRESQQPQRRPSLSALHDGSGSGRVLAMAKNARTSKDWSNRASFSLGSGEAASVGSSPSRVHPEVE